MSLTVLLLCLTQILFADSACEVPIAKFWASANKGVATYYKLQGTANKPNKTAADAFKVEAGTAKTAFSTWKKEVISSMKIKCLVAGSSQASASFSAKNNGTAASQGVDIGSACLTQIGQNNYWLTTKNKGLDYSVSQTNEVLDNCMGLFQSAGTNLTVSKTVTDAVLNVGASISSTVNANPSKAPHFFKTSTYVVKPIKFPVFAQKAAFTFYKLFYNNKLASATQDKATYVNQTKALKASIKLIKIDFKKGTGAGTIKEINAGTGWSNTWALNIWVAILDTSSISAGLKYNQIYFFAETQNYLVDCFVSILNLTATANPTSVTTPGSSFQTCVGVQVDIITRCFNLGLLVTTLAPSTSVQLITGKNVTIPTANTTAGQGNATTFGGDTTSVTSSGSSSSPKISSTACCVCGAASTVSMHRCFHSSEFAGKVVLSTGTGQVSASSSSGTPMDTTTMAKSTYSIPVVTSCMTWPQWNATTANCPLTCPALFC